MNNLHDAIMNLPCVPNGLHGLATDTERAVYKIGHRDARHAAAELAQEHTAALIAENARLRTFAEKVAATDLRDVNSYAHGWVKSFIDAARSALSDNPARSANRSEK